MYTKINPRYSRKFACDDVRREAGRVVDDEEALVPRRVVAEVALEEMVDILELGRPQVELLQHPLPALTTKLIWL